MPVVRRSWARVVRAAPLLVLVTGLASCAGITVADLSTPAPAPDGACVVVGFLGGRDSWDDADKGIRKLALELRDPARGVYVETFENQRRDVAEAFVARSWHPSARLVVYGQSFGGAAVVKFVRTLEQRGVPVLLSLQIDSVGRGDGAIPANVQHAANLYQDDGWFIRGEHPIRADDADATRILGNWRFRYDVPPGSDISLDGVPFFKRLFRIPHAKMDRDPRIWSVVELLIGSACAGRDLVRIAESIDAS